MGDAAVDGASFTCFSQETGFTILHTWAPLIRFNLRVTFAVSAQDKKFEPQCVGPSTIFPEDSARSLGSGCTKFCTSKFSNTTLAIRAVLELSEVTSFIVNAFIRIIETHQRCRRASKQNIL